MSGTMTRRLATAGLAATGLSLARRDAAAAQSPAAAEAANWRLLAAAPARHRLRPEPAGETEVWAFDGRLPGPVIRLRRGQEARLRLTNGVGKPLSLHGQGLRIANAMDGLATLTQPPVAPGASFDYRFTPPDAGLFLLRPLVPGASSELSGRGLSALIIVEDGAAPAVDREATLLVEDWRLGEDGALAPFGDPLEAASGGRLGNLLAVNAAAAPARLACAANARLRLRLANGCNARAFRIRFDGLRTWVAAIDGQPTNAFEPLRSTLPFPPGSRYDLFVEAPSQPGARGRITALIGPGLALAEIVTEGDARPAGGPPPSAFPDNRLLPAEIKLQRALRREVVVAGGARIEADGRPAYAGPPDAIWTVNGRAGSAAAPPLFSVKRGTPVVLTLRNRTAFAQPLHLHGHAFRLLHAMDDGWEPYWLDTLLIPEGRSAMIAFVADNPGRWGLTATVLERFDTGLWGWFEVT